MAAYNIGQITRKQVAGKDIIVCNVKDNDGTVTNNVTIWKTDKDGKVFPGFDTINSGSVVEGNLWTKPGTENVTLYPPKDKKSFAPSAGLMKAKTESIQKFQETKTHSIERAQERNEVMYAKKGAAEIIAHHPAYKDLNNLNLSSVFQNLAQTIYDFNPASSLTSMERDNIISHTSSMNRAIASDSEEIDADSIPF